MINIKEAKLKNSFRRLFEEKELGMSESDNLIWRCKDAAHLEADVILVFTVKNYIFIDPISKLINEVQPQIITKQVSFSDSKALFITADQEYLKTAATQMGLKFDNHLSSEQRQTIIRFNLNVIKWFRESSSFDMNHITLLRLINGEAVIPKLIKLKCIKQMLPLHDDAYLTHLRKIWVTEIFSTQPLQEIYQYFGIKIAMYFAFLGHYTWALTIPATIGVMTNFWSTADKKNDLYYKVLLSILTILWSAFYLESWQEYQTSLIKKWQPSFLNLKTFTPRPQYYGEVIQRSNQFRIIYPDWKRNLFFYSITIPIMAFSLFTVFIIMLYMLHFQNWWDNVSNSTSEWISYVPRVCFGCIIYAMDVVYHKMARWLNKKENYENEEAYETNLLLKYILFQFVNSFLSLFYIAFYIGDVEKLREQLAALFITRQVIGNLKETLWPFLTQSFRLSTTLRHLDISKAEFESNLYRYESTFEDYLELYIQFGYVTMFASTFPFGALCSLVNNLIEIRSDAFKLCVTFQRPFSVTGVKNIIIWQKAMNIMVYIAIFVNGLLIAKFGAHSHLFSNLNNLSIVVGCVVLEILLIATKLIIRRIRYTNWLKGWAFEEKMKEE